MNGFISIFIETKDREESCITICAVRSSVTSAMVAGNVEADYGGPHCQDQKVTKLRENLVDENYALKLLKNRLGQVSDNLARIIHE